MDRWGATREFPLHAQSLPNVEIARASVVALAAPARHHFTDARDPLHRFGIRRFRGPDQQSA